MTDDGFVKVEWTYAGRRWGSDRKIDHILIDETGTELHYSKGPGGTSAAVGGIYEVEVKREDKDGATTTRARLADARYLRPSDSDDLEKWRLADQAAGTAKTTAGLESSLKRKGTEIHDLTLAEIRQLMWKRGTSSAAVLAVVIRYLNGDS